MVISCESVSNKTVSRLTHRMKAPSSMVVTLAGILMLVRFSQSKKALSPMDVMPSPISTDLISSL